MSLVLRKWGLSKQKQRGDNVFYHTVCTISYFKIRGKLGIFETHRQLGKQNFASLILTIPSLGLSNIPYHGLSFGTKDSLPNNQVSDFYQIKLTHHNRQQLQ